jgi:single-stranded DNA-binding protein
LPDVNVLVLTGVATKDAQLRPKASGQVKAEFSFEVTRPFFRTDGEPVSDLFLIDAWGPLGEWAHDKVKQGTRLLIIGTLNKESYITRHGGKEHLTIVKAKEIRPLEGDALAETPLDYGEVRKDHWHEELVNAQLELVRQLASEVASPALSLD